MNSSGGRSQAPVALRESDEMIFARFAKSRSDEDFRPLYDRYHRKIVQFFAKRVNDVVIADDLAQDAFVRMIRAADKFDPRRPFSNWAFTICYNLLQNYYRSCSRRRVQAFTEAFDAEEIQHVAERMLVSKELNPEEVVYLNELTVAASEAMEALPEHQRVAFELSREGYALKEIADLFGGCEKQARNNSGEARKKMRKRVMPVLAAAA